MTVNTPVGRCDSCNAADRPWCWLASIGRCDWLAAPHWSRHNAARSALPPPEVAAPAPPAPPIDVAARRAAKPRIALGTPHPRPGDG